MVNPVYIIPYFLFVYVFGAGSGSSDYTMYAADSAGAVTGSYSDDGTYLYHAAADDKQWTMTIRQTPSGNPYLIFALKGESWQGILKGGDTLAPSGNEFQTKYHGTVRYGTRSMNVEISIMGTSCGNGTDPATSHQVHIMAAGQSYRGCCRQGAN